jgi:predicted O-methyltransferase YrrM
VASFATAARDRRTLRFIKNATLDRYYWHKSKYEFAAGLANTTCLNDAISLAWNFKGAGYYAALKPNQDRGEIHTLAERVRSIGPKVIVEIGTRLGGTLFCWSQCSANLELLVSIDLPSGIHGGGYPHQRARLYELFVSNQPLARLELLRLDSQQASTQARLLEILCDRPIDFLFIDGDHRYPGIKRDYELYASAVRPGGLIAFHDIRPNAELESIQVYKLWDEIKVKAAHTEEIIHEPYRGRYGIGLLTKTIES